MIIEVKPLHQKKAKSPILVTESGMFIEVKPQQEKAFSPILVTESEMIIEVKPLHQ
jgi:hypothetical protein